MREKNKKSHLCFLTAFLSIISFGYGQIIFNNPITGDNINPEVSNPYTDGQYADSNIQAYGIGKGIGAVGSEGGFPTKDRYNLRGWNTETLNPQAYFEFVMEPNTGYGIDFISFQYSGQASAMGPVYFAFRSSLDNYTADIGIPSVQGTTIDLSSFQNITQTISFRIYAWGASSGLGTFSINDFSFNGVVSPLPCAFTTVWNGLMWSNGVPDLTAEVIIDGDYNTSISGSFSACSLTVNAGAGLTIGNETFVEVINHVVVSGELLVDTKGSFVQIDRNGTFTLNEDGNSIVRKETALKNAWYYYTYWSSPVSGQTIADAFPNTDSNRRFWFNTANYYDGNGDGVDDDGNDWVIAPGSSVMTPGVGYIATSSRLGPYPSTDIVTFSGYFNTGNISRNIVYNATNASSWNLIGNPYPSALDFDAFYAANSDIIDGVAYLWSHHSPPLSTNPGNQALNFSQDDYAMYVTGVGAGIAGASGVIPTQYIPSCQGFFVVGLATRNAVFTNAMRKADGANNSQFFKDSNSKKNDEKNKLWINLTSDNGVFNQILTAYVDGATNEDDGLSYDAPRILANNYAAALYSQIEHSPKKFAVQGKDVTSLDANETIRLGFATNISAETVYTLSIAQLQGDFLTHNTIYLRDNLLDKVHNLSEADYIFTSEVGEFNDRFVVIFNNPSESIDDLVAETNTLKIIEVSDDQVTFMVYNNVTIKSVSIFDVMGRELYRFKGNSSEETYLLTNLKNSIYIARVELSNGTFITKKAIKK